MLPRLSIPKAYKLKTLCHHYSLTPIRSVVEVVGETSLNSPRRAPTSRIYSRKRTRLLIIDQKLAHIPRRGDVVGKLLHLIAVYDLKASRVYNGYSTVYNVWHINPLRQGSQRVLNLFSHHLRVDVFLFFLFLCLLFLLLVV